MWTLSLNLLHMIFKLQMLTSTSIHCRKSLCLHKPATFSFLRAALAQMSMSAWLWGLCCFLIVIVSSLRLRGFAKEGGGHPGWACAGVASRWGNPGQEGRNQGRRANERVSGETHCSPSPLSFLSSVICYSLCLVLVVFLLCQPVSSFYLSVLPSVFVFLCLSPPLSLGACFVCDIPPGSKCVRMCTRVCVCVCVLNSNCVWLHWSQSWESTCVYE